MTCILSELQKISEVEAIAIGGSSVAKSSDNKSDIDVYVFSRKDIPLPNRQSVILPVSSKYEIGGEYFGSGDEFWADNENVQYDVMYWNMTWFESVINNTWIKHYPSNGYSTCFIFTLKNFKIIYDKNNWLKNLQQKINTPYPKELKENIINRNLMLMKEKPFASYYEQIEKAVIRNDIVSINHRLAAFVASYFDILLAFNEQLHPGEKRLIPYAKKNCQKLPNNFEINLSEALNNPKDILSVLDKIYLELKNIL